MPAPVDESDPEVVPVFGTWRLIYASVIIVNLAAMVLVYLFSGFRF